MNFISFGKLVMDDAVPHVVTFKFPGGILIGFGFPEIETGVKQGKRIIFCLMGFAIQVIIDLIGGLCLGN